MLIYTKTEPNYYFNISVGGGSTRAILMDTGSTGIVVPLDTIKSYTELSPQPPTPGYSSSGRSYEGKWVQTSAQIFGLGADNNPPTTQKINVFGVTNISGKDESEVQQVSMMGVGFWNKNYSAAAFNPFINIQNLPKNATQGYIITSTGVYLGLSDALTEGFQFFELDPIRDVKDSYNLQQGCVSLEYQTLRYRLEAPLLVDTGIPYMIITPGTQSEHPTGYGEGGDFYPGVHVTVDVSSQTDKVPRPYSYSFTTSSTSNSPTASASSSAAPKFVRWGAAPPSNPATIINTGRNFINAFDYLFDPVNSRIGIRPSTTTTA